MLCFISENIGGTIKRFSFKEVLWLIGLVMVSHLEMQTYQQIHHARWELPPLRWMMSFLPPWTCPLPSSLKINILGWQMRLCGVIGNIQYPARLFYLYKDLISVCLHVMSLSFYNQRTKYRQLSMFPFPKNAQFSSKIDQFLIIATRSFYRTQVRS